MIVSTLASDPSSSDAQPAFSMPPFADFIAMPASEFVTFWTMYREAFALPPDTHQLIRMAIDLRAKGWEIASGDTLRDSLWRHPAKHHSIFRVHVAHELEARGWPLASASSVICSRIPGGRMRLL